MTFVPLTVPVLYLAIPAHNEVATIGVLLWRLRTVLTEFPREYEVVVYDDASTDDTAAVAEQYERAMPVTVLRGASRLGYAGAVDALLRHIAGQTRYPRRDAVLLLQGDFTDPPGIVPEFARRFEGGADLVVGERLTVADAPTAVKRLFKYAHWAMRAFVKVEGVKDLSASMRLVRISALREAIRQAGNAPLVSGDSWTANTDLLLRLAPHARRVESVPMEPTFGVRMRDTRRVAMTDTLAALKWAWGARGRRAVVGSSPAESGGDERRPRHGSRRRDEPELSVERLREKVRERDGSSGIDGEQQDPRRRRGRDGGREGGRDQERARGERAARGEARSEARSEARGEARSESRNEPRSERAEREKPVDLSRDPAAGPSRAREGREAREPREPREGRTPREAREPREPREKRGPRPDRVADGARAADSRSAEGRSASGEARPAESRPGRRREEPRSPFADPTLELDDPFAPPSARRERTFDDLVNAATTDERGMAQRSPDVADSAEAASGARPAPPAGETAGESGGEAAGVAEMPAPSAGRERSPYRDTDDADGNRAAGDRADDNADDRADDSQGDSQDDSEDDGEENGAEAGGEGEEGGVDAEGHPRKRRRNRRSRRGRRRKGARGENGESGEGSDAGGEGGEGEGAESEGDTPRARRERVQFTPADHIDGEPVRVAGADETDDDGDDAAGDDDMGGVESMSDGAARPRRRGRRGRRGGARRSRGRKDKGDAGEAGPAAE